MSARRRPGAGAYRAIYADPPWRFATYSDKGKGRSAEAHYDCMTLPEIKAHAGGELGGPRRGPVPVDHRPDAAPRAWT